MAESPTSPPVVGTHVPAGYADPAGPTEISLLDLATMLLRHRRLIVLPPLVLFVLVVGFTLLKPRTWTATASFIPQSSASSLSRLAGFAAQLGVAVPGGARGEHGLLRRFPGVRPAAAGAGLGALHSAGGRGGAAGNAGGFLRDRGGGQRGGPREGGGGTAR